MSANKAHGADCSLCRDGYPSHDCVCAACYRAWCELRPEPHGWAA